MLIIDGKPVSSADAAWEMAKREVERVMPTENKFEGNIVVINGESMPLSEYKVTNWQARAEAAEARVKALEEALRQVDDEAKAAIAYEAQNSGQDEHVPLGLRSHAWIKLSMIRSYVSAASLTQKPGA